MRKDKWLAWKINVKMMMSWLCVRIPLLRLITISHEIAWFAKWIIDPGHEGKGLCPVRFLPCLLHLRLTIPQFDICMQKRTGSKFFMLMMLMTSTTTVTVIDPLIDFAWQDLIRNDLDDLLIECCVFCGTLLPLKRLLTWSAQGDIYVRSWIRAKTMP